MAVLPRRVPAGSRLPCVERRRRRRRRRRWRDRHGGGSRRGRRSRRAASAIVDAAADTLHVHNRAQQAAVRAQCRRRRCAARRRIATHTSILDDAPRIDSCVREYSQIVARAYNPPITSRKRLYDTTPPPRRRVPQVMVPRRRVRRDAPLASPPRPLANHWFADPRRLDHVVARDRRDHVSVRFRVARERGRRIICCLTSPRVCPVVRCHPPLARNDRPWWCRARRRDAREQMQKRYAEFEPIGPLPVETPPRAECTEFMGRGVKTWFERSASRAVNPAIQPKTRVSVQQVPDDARMQ